MFQFYFCFLLVTEIMSISSIPASPFSGFNATPSPTVVLNDTLHALDRALANKLAGSAVSLQPVELRHYGYEEVRLSVEQNADTIFPLRDVKSNQVSSLVALILQIIFDYRHEHRNCYTVCET